MGAVAELLTHAMDGDLSRVAPRDIVMVEFQKETHEGTVRAVEGGRILVDVHVDAERSVLCVVDHAAIVDVIGRAA